MCKVPIDGQKFSCHDKIVLKYSKNQVCNCLNGIAFLDPQKYSLILDWCRKNSEVGPERIAHMMPLGINENGAIKWHPFSKAIIDEFGDNDDVLSMLSSNMGSFGSVGSRIPYFTTQKLLLQELITHKITRVRKWAAKMLEYTEITINREKLEDEERFLI